MRAEKARAAAWFTELRDTICAAFERLEDEQTTGPHARLPAGRFTRKETRRQGEAGEESGGGVMSVMREGRVFEKVGVNISTVHGRLGEAAQRSLTARKEVPGLKDDPRFWASGVSLVAHMRSPKTPAIHMNTRMFWTPFCWWFGGGTDLNPMVEVAEDTAFFHGVLKAACDRHDPAYYPAHKAWADEYFMIRHWDEPRGVGGIFYDDLCTGDWEADFAYTQDVGRAFLDAFLPITEKRRDEPWTDADREAQLVKRGRYAEFNLVYDRGTKFGLETGHNPEAVLMSLPPVAKWP
ncbi:oxygen-dependent coproporphyrinogen oxidase [Pikeienuella piscinae]|uniref:coproporphyrinogen oxidase n=1 Tax=Pikeienuella piscinae TaxID=2748098 RepID=A0A7M3T7B1_9RHOB|nr:oxygen-dependent coproporphyrinogen oxidase [Pikeienuella piscinae]QIE57892.1 oxygen-dependent coproporphyrinogen oxidase [Pikeienuella piscinae]